MSGGCRYKMLRLAGMHLRGHAYDDMEGGGLYNATDRTNELTMQSSKDTVEDEMPITKRWSEL